MGEYIRARDTAGNVHDIKIGVCEELYRIRRSEADRIAQSYTGELSSMYRFPYPDEDGTEYDLDAIEAREERHDALRFPPEVRPDFEHGSYCTHVKAENDPYAGFNLFLTCPQSTGKNTTGPARPGPFNWHEASTSCGVSFNEFKAVIMGVRYDEAGNPRTIFKCGFCGYPFSLTAAEIEQVTAHQTELRKAAAKGWQPEPVLNEATAARLTGRADA
jgi:hypothetical protein